MKTKATNCDKKIGEVLKFLRKLKGVSQASIAKQIGVSFQQVQKYENGKNRISASNLYKICQILEVNIAEFYEQVFDEKKFSILQSITNSQETIRMANAWNYINDENFKNSIINLIEHKAKKLS